MKNTVAIIGSHPRTRELFDTSRTDADIWLFNEAVSNKLNTWVDRADAIFQMHVPPIWKNPQNRNDPNHYNWLQTQSEVSVIYMQDKYTEVPAAVSYPLADIKAMTDGAHFLSSSVSLAIALAIHKGYKRIEVYGVAMETNTEYQFQREGVAFWYGYAKGKGIEFYFADTTFECPVYGYEGEVSIKYEKFTERIETLTPAKVEADGRYKSAHLSLANAVAAFEADSSKVNEENLYKALEQARTFAAHLGGIDGGLHENNRYKEKADAMKEQAGEFIFSRQEFEASLKTTSDRQQSALINMNAIGLNLANIQKQAAGASKKGNKRAQIFGAFRQYLDRYMAACHEIAFYKGASDENYNYMTHLDKHIRAAGGSKSEEVLLRV